MCPVVKQTKACELFDFDFGKRLESVGVVRYEAPLPKCRDCRVGGDERFKGRVPACWWVSSRELGVKHDRVSDLPPCMPSVPEEARLSQR